MMEDEQKLSDDLATSDSENPDSLYTTPTTSFVGILQPATPSSFVFCSSVTGGPLLTIKPDGTIERGPAFTTNDEASLQFWQILSDTFGLWKDKK